MKKIINDWAKQRTKKIGNDWVKQCTKKIDNDWAKQHEEDRQWLNKSTRLTMIEQSSTWRRLKTIK
jgi:hypothetical protein